MRSPIDAGTVLITNASSEVGRECARQLARRARTLVLVARQEQRLEDLRDELLVHNPTLGVVVEPCDLSQPDQVLALLDALQRDLVRVDVLVHVTHPGDVGLYEQQPWEGLHHAVREDVVAPLLLTHRLVRRMVKRKWGGLLHIGTGGVCPVAPGRALQSATQGFLEGFTESLRLELLGSGVVVTQVLPGPVGQGAVPAWMGISAWQCAREAIAGFDHAEPQVRPGRAYRWLSRVWALLPRRVMRAAGVGVARRLRAGPALPQAPILGSGAEALLSSGPGGGAVVGSP